jgi:hypothetical protein
MAGNWRPTDILYLEDERKYGLRKIMSYQWFLYIYMLPIIFIIALIFFIRFQTYSVWTNNPVIDHIIFGLMFLLYLIVFPPRRRFAHVAKIELHNDMMIPPFKPFKKWILRQQYHEDIIRINPIQIGDKTIIEKVIEVVLSTGKIWYFTVTENHINGFLEVRSNDNKILVSNMDLKILKLIIEKYNLNSSWVN